MNATPKTFAPAFRAKLIAALESGEHKHGRNYLEQTDSDGVTRRCCLGVACRIEGLEPVKRFIGYSIASPADLSLPGPSMTAQPAWNGKAIDIFGPDYDNRTVMALEEKLSIINDSYVGDDFGPVITWLRQADAVPEATD